MQVSTSMYSGGSLHTHIFLFLLDKSRQYRKFITREIRKFTRTFISDRFEQCTRYIDNFIPKKMFVYELHPLYYKT